MAKNQTLIELRIKAAYLQLWMKSDPDWLRRVDNPLIWNIAPFFILLWGFTLGSLVFSHPFHPEFLGPTFFFSGLMVYYYRRGKRILPKLNQNFEKAKASHPAWKKDINALEALLLKQQLQGAVDKAPLGKPHSKKRL